MTDREALQAHKDRVAAAMRRIPPDLIQPLPYIGGFPGHPTRKSERLLRWRIWRRLTRT